MLEVAHMGLHAAQMTGQTAMRQCFDAVTVNGARLPDWIRDLLSGTFRDVGP